MQKYTTKLKKIWEFQKKALRDPRDLWTCSLKSSGIRSETLKFHADKKIIELLAELNLTLFVSREYENLLISFFSDGSRIVQSFIPMAHPSGIACDRNLSLLYVASTRNPNIIYQFRPSEGVRSSYQYSNEQPMVVARKKYYPGAYYFHDLALISGELFANAVGMNGIVHLNLNQPDLEGLAWYPKCIEGKNGVARTEKNYIQLNSIAAGNSLSESFFSASGDKIGVRRPGHLNYPVNKRGVILSGKTRATLARGLTRPHSAKLYKSKIWVANSGYGEFGFVSGESFEPVIKLKGWTRGVCIYKDIAFVATSRIIPQFRHYAPGLTDTDNQCALYAISLITGNILGKLIWPSGNQVFAIDYFPRKTTCGFLQKNTNEQLKKLCQIAYLHK